MNVYDFDKTIYRGDSTIDFYIYCLQHNPKIICCVPKQLNAALAYYLFKKYTKTEWKEKFFCFLTQIDDLNMAVEQFWDKNEKKIQNWYLEMKKATDIVISASPEFLLQEICKRLKIGQPIASKVNVDGRFFSPNCYGKEKVRCFCEKFSLDSIEKFYSDSLSDEPMAKLAKEAFLVKADQIYKWPFD